MSIKVTAPTRIDISAGWSDANPFSEDFGGAVLNAAINYRVSASLKDGKLITSLDDVPSNSGLGTSGALRTVFLVASNPELIKDKSDKEKKDLIKRVHKFENAIVGQRAGFQDQAAAIYGGVNYWEFRRDGDIKRIPISNHKSKHLYERLVLVYTGDRHQSSSVHADVFQARKYMRAIPIIGKMKVISKLMLKNISNEKVMAELIAHTWVLQKSLDKNMESPAMGKLQMVCKDCYLACRATGAGGGGCMLFYTNPKSKKSLLKQFAVLSKKNKRMRVLPFKFDEKGIEISGA